MCGSRKRCRLTKKDKEGIIRSRDRIVLIMEISMPGKTVFILKLIQIISDNDADSRRWKWVIIHSFQHHAIWHYDDVIMTMLASQITSLMVVHSIVYSGVNQRKHQSPASLAFVREIHRGPVNFPHKWPVTRKMFPFDDVIMDMDIGWRSNSFVWDGNYFYVWWNYLSIPKLQRYNRWSFGMDK